MEAHETNEEPRFRFIADSVEDVISVRDRDGKRVYTNQAYRDLFGEENAQQPDAAFHHISSNDRERVSHAFIRVVQTGKPDEIEYDAFLTGGKKHHLKSRTAPILDKTGAVSEVVIVTKDLTRQKQLEEAQQRHRRELEQRIGEMSALNSIATQLHRCNAVDELKKVLKIDAPNLFPLCSGALYLFMPELQQFEELVSWGDDNGREKYFSYEQCWSSRCDNGIHVVDDPDPNNPYLCSHAGENRHPYFCIQMRGKGGIQVLLHLEMKSSLETLASDEEKRRAMRALQEVAAAITRHFALAFENLKQKGDLQKSAELDALTGLYNRHFLNSALKKEVLRAARNKTILGVIMADVDHFKKINDSYTHSGGDYVLKEVGHFLGKHIRETDIPCRYGGEEFMLIMPDTSPKGLEDRAEAIREGIKALDLKHYGRPVKVTLSLGVALMTGQEVISPDTDIIRLGDSAQFVAEEKAEEITQAADTALYQAKRQGRDRVVFWQNAYKTETSLL